MRNLIEEWRKYIGITKMYGWVNGRIIIKWRSRIIYNGKLKTKYFNKIWEAERHYKEEIHKENEERRRERIKNKYPKYTKYMRKRKTG